MRVLVMADVILRDMSFEVGKGIGTEGIDVYGSYRG